MAFDRKSYMAEYNKRYYAENRSYWEQRYAENKEEHNKKSKIWKSKNKDKANAISQKWRDNNGEKFRVSVKRSRVKRIAEHLANNAKRRSIRIQRTVVWADQKKIEDYYKLAKFFEWITLGIKYHVDHIVPLQGENVCGLHTHDNLQVLRADVNLKKSNKLEVQFG